MKAIIILLIVLGVLLLLPISRKMMFDLDLVFKDREQPSSGGGGGGSYYNVPVVNETVTEEKIIFVEEKPNYIPLFLILGLLFIIFKRRK